MNSKAFRGSSAGESLPAPKQLVSRPLSCKPHGEMALAEGAKLDTDCLVAINLLQRGAYGKDLELTRAQLLKENGRLKTQLLLLGQELSQRWSRHELHLNLRNPLWLTLLVAAVLGGTYLVIYFFHLVAFFSSRNSVKLQNRRRGITEAPLPLPNWETYSKEVIQRRFVCGLRRTTVLRLMVLLVLITLSGSYLASQGYFKPIEEKLVPYVYLALLVLLIGQAILREIWTRAFQNFGPMVETMTKFSSAMQNWNDGVFMKEIREGMSHFTA